VLLIGSLGFVLGMAAISGARTLYPLLARLEIAGLISSVGMRERASRRAPGPTPSPTAAGTGFGR
jgi:hypothetical protein